MSITPSRRQRGAPQSERAHAQTGDDIELLRRIAADDDEALRLFYQRYAGLAYSLAFRILHDQSRAEEVLQETFIRVWRAAITFDPTRGQPETWVVTIARNLAFSALRKERTSALMDSLDDHAEAVEAMTNTSEEPEELVWMDERRQVVHEALMQLPAQQRDVVLWTYFGGFTQREIAERTGEPLGTIKSRLRLALNRLQGLLRTSLGDAWEDYKQQPQSLLR